MSLRSSKAMQPSFYDYAKLKCGVLSVSVSVSACYLTKTKFSVMARLSASVADLSGHAQNGKCRSNTDSNNL